MARRPGLGQGLNALIPGGEGEDQSPRTATGITQLPIDAIQPNPQQPRVDMDEETIQELADSIREYGIIQPLLVSKSM
ncbi:MAG: ParB N-terminal domain-containing protein, partial [Anaerolineales bacterium]